MEDSPNGLTWNPDLQEYYNAETFTWNRERQTYEVRLDTEVCLLPHQKRMRDICNGTLTMQMRQTPSRRR